VRGVTAALALVALTSAGAALAPRPILAHEAALPALDYELPAPGTYTLQRIMPAPDGEVVGLDGHPQRLARFTHDRITVLGFIYTTCIDPEGCPLAHRVFDSLQRSIIETPALRGRVRLVTLSFDPARDTPAALRAYAGHRPADDHSGAAWYFFTTRSTRQLTPLVEGFGQDVRVSVDRLGGLPRREISHVLKVFLIDRSGIIREIYSSLFLHPQTVLNDIETLLMEP